MNDVEARNLATSRCWLEEVFNNHNLAAVAEIVSPAYTNVGTTNATGLEGGRQVIQQMDDWAPDRRIDIKYMAARDDVVLILFSLSGTHTGQFGDIPPTGRRFSVWLCDVFRFDESGAMIEGWVIGKGELRAALSQGSDRKIHA
jgi:predicted ester cyclase